MEQPDSLKALVDVLEKVPHSYWAEKEPWKIIIMFWTVLNLHALEPALFLLCLKFPKMAHWFKELAEDSDKKPNLVDAIRIVMILLVLWAGRGFIICGIWWCIFQENQAALMGVLAGFIASMLASAIFTGHKNQNHVEDKITNRRQAEEPAN